MIITTETIISIFLGIGLAASVGFRIFLPLFALSLASYFNVWELNGSWQWIGSFTALVISIVTICLPIIGFVLALILAFIIFKIFKKIKRTSS